MDIASNRRKRRKLEVNIVPLVDVFTVLIFFFLLTMQFKEVHVADINLPSMQSAQASTKTETPDSISITKDGEIYFNKNKISEEALEKELQKFAKQNPDKALVILADKKANIEKFASVFDKARLAQIKKIVFQTTADSKKK